MDPHTNHTRPLSTHSDADVSDVGETPSRKRRRVDETTGGGSRPGPSSSVNQEIEVLDSSSADEAPRSSLAGPSRKRSTPPRYSAAAKGKGKAVALDDISEIDTGNEADLETESSSRPSASKSGYLSKAAGSATQPRDNPLDLPSVEHEAPRGLDPTLAEAAAPASEYNCPICFCVPTAAVLTPCGHVMCGSCLFSSVESAATRARSMGQGGEALKARCPVCRAELEDWDGRGGGVIGLEIRLSTAL
ncbi:hypothetical protein FRB99_000395 [Tulasnella sp. 403]|nr:hypothetical protein FRB99_000395 [Tulasnella sp. 403]